MKLNNKIKTSIDAIAKKWDYSGHFILVKNKDILHNEFYGYQNREKSIKTTSTTRYLIDSEHKFLVNFAILIAITQNKINFNDYANQYIPELMNGEKIKIENLLKNDSGLFDFYHSHLMIQFEDDDHFKTLNEQERVRKEKEKRKKHFI